MKPLYKYILIAVLVLGLAGLTAAGVVYAQSDDPPAKAGLAELLGLTRDELREKLQEGATLEELAAEAGVDLEAYYQERQAAWQEDFSSRIESALENGEITQEHADWLLEGLEKGFLKGDGLLGVHPGPGTRGSREGSMPFEDGQRPGRDSQTDS